MAKMYYSEQEAAEKLGISTEDLLNRVRGGEIRAYADGSSRMFKVTDVDQMADAVIVDAGQSDIQLSPVEMSGTHAPVSLSDTEDTTVVDAAGTRSGTVLTSEGISIFDDEDLDLQDADPMAKTQIAPTLDEGMGLEGLSSGGSGLLDLTREGDDTSLGSDVLDHIDMESGELPSVESVAEGLSQEMAANAPRVAAAPEAVTLYDASEPIFTGLAAAGAAIAMVLGVVAIGILAGTTSPLAVTLGNNITIVAGGAVGLLVIGAAIGMVVGKKGATPQG